MWSYKLSPPVPQHQEHLLSLQNVLKLLKETSQQCETRKEQLNAQLLEIQGEIDELLEDDTSSEASCEEMVEPLVVDDDLSKGKKKNQTRNLS
ncbi:hypothetical protein Syun_014590 [Stephania yunnanensis]|uniref:Uncharacterized protein n=1 Tax=Stephania yunnanensis TaxID=152371 RepID=A0AAP0JKH6_9MAGN